MLPYVNASQAAELLSRYGNEDNYIKQSQERREALVEMATIGINALGGAAFGLGYSGRKLEASQENEFPRDLWPKVPFEVQLACALEAGALAGGENADRARLRMSGVEAASISGASERYKPVSRSELFVSKPVYALLVRFLNRGSFPVEN